MSSSRRPAQPVIDRGVFPSQWPSQPVIDGGLLPRRLPPELGIDLRSSTGSMTRLAERSAVASHGEQAMEYIACSPCEFGSPGAHAMLHCLAFTRPSDLTSLSGKVESLEGEVQLPLGDVTSPPGEFTSPLGD
ncbi:uncharacterized protein PGTG_14664 [Puccinia graminis f. sp. tritici CRL 75-36-700-3]|uniref:Uncharacterized protein n=1 Tax=Puccinia graminis f. sp. tritici (strain CRL 75-36-700-3 / race SCCL) TaxID=418459 RepID=E3KWN1_PUCGT|nr:uncharacterized protein PGTG_14664 [Puccinia graminis f. sp. tritici CRL 75-36-700-3]EFP88698.2 hypothetical protein PGTG_14664 [Puccinia graminis f. sp. tritici CRL 75-36-700-3]